MSVLKGALRKLPETPTILTVCISSLLLMSDSLVPAATKLIETSLSSWIKSVKRKIRISVILN